jgi:outer membrane protein assembly factor BamB
MESGERSGGIGTERKLALGLGGVGLVIAAMIAILSSGSSSSEQSMHVAASAFPNGDPSNTRSTGGPIQATTVSRLSTAWTLPLGGQAPHGAYWSSPVIDGEVVYSQDSASNVQAIDLATGRILWEKPYGSTIEGPNGVTVAGGRVYGATTSNAFALDQRTGKELWSTPLIRSESEGIEMAPGYHDGLVYVSTSPKSLEGGEVGILWALDAKTGKKVWSFDTVPKGLWGDPQVNFGGGLSQPPAFDSEGSMYFGVDNPGPIAGTEEKPWGSSRPGPNLYTGSIVKLDSSTGKLDWYYQLTPHMLCDWDLQGPPVLISSGGSDLVVITGKAGIVVALDRDTGKLVWKRLVGTHNGHDNDGIHAMEGDYSSLKIPMTVYPGNQGGVLSPASTDGSTIYVPVVNNSSTLQSQESGKAGRSQTGEVVALDAGTGAIRWKRHLSGAAYGATSVANDLVFASTLAGTLYALETGTGDIAWQVKLPAWMIAGVSVSGDTLLAPAGVEYESARPQMVAFRLGG